MSFYEKLGVRPIINAAGTLTMLGGSIMDPDVLKTMEEASQSYINMDNFHKKAGEQIATLLGAESACITSGAAAGLAIAAAACMTGTNKANILQLPDTSGMKGKGLVLKCHRILYDQALSLSGVEMNEIGTTSFSCLEMIEQAIDDHTAFFFYAAECETMRGSLPVEEIVPILHKKGIPLIVDAAAEIPPKSNILKYLEIGASMVIFSGGKEIRGPQSSGVILGKQSLIEACDANCCPNHSIGRPMKIDKETIAGFVKAVELFIKKDYEKEMLKWNRMVDEIINELSLLKKLKLHKGYPSEPGIQPTIIPRVYLNFPDRTPHEVQETLLAGEPAIQIGIEGNTLAINPQCLKDFEVPLIINKIRILAE